jgi:polygalacturonase
VDLKLKSNINNAIAKNAMKNLIYTFDNQDGSKTIKFSTAGLNAVYMRLDKNIMIKDCSLNKGIFRADFENISGRSITIFGDSLNKLIDEANTYFGVKK